MCFLSLNTANISVHSPLDRVIFEGKLHLILPFALLYVRCHAHTMTSLTIFFFLSLGFWSLNIICLGIVILEYILLGVLWDSWICFVSHINLQEILLLLFKYYLSLSLSYSHYVCVTPLPFTFYSYSTVLGNSVSFFHFFPFFFSPFALCCYSFGSFSCHLLKLRVPSSAMSSLLLRPSKNFFISVIVFSIYSISFHPFLEFSLLFYYFITFSL